MPIYEYICLQCNRNFAALQRVGATEKDTLCPECGSTDIKKKLSAFSCSAGGAPSSSPSSHRFSGGG